MPRSLVRCLNAVVLASLCAALLVGLLGNIFRLFGMLLSEGGNALALSADWLHNLAAKRRR